MSYVGENDVLVGGKTLKANYDQVLANCVALAAANPRIPIGGYFSDVYINTSYEELFGVVHVKIDGTNLAGLTVRLVFMAKTLSGTGYVKLYKITPTAGDVASSETTWTNTTADRKESSALTLTTGVNEYKLLVKSSVAAAMPQIWNAALSITG